MRLVNADEIVKNRVSNDPVVIAVNNAETVSAISVPINLGQEVWVIIKYNGKPLTIVNDYVSMIGITTRSIHIKLRNYKDFNKTYILGKLAFISHEDALKEFNRLKGEAK